MDRYVLLVKAPKGMDIFLIREELKEFLSERHPELKVELHRCIGLTVDLVILYREGVVLIKRKHEPFKDHFALPGGFVEYGEPVEDAAVREAKEETGLDVRLLRLIGVYSDPNRDPRGHTVTVAFLALGTGELKAGDDAKDVMVVPIDEVNEIPLAFDHEKILRDALELR
ncbi:NUDIX hydrolase [Thermococcus sp. GR7]|uniref:NUDIX domain-containing protein n=1 Tax=unclassified Thermococcus TaxID=2627626 RepID=UPI001430B6D9|nr:MULTISPECIES: NUDIX hydrolase [unclassified Thermococcus]NJE46918.1 NUDIX hydrolase [Thermococcus sp. GR7]NJE78415.1 NUDIX hydrolase [Thermococcus sp. GR4]NJF23288.1 NUDIX hydrolase [Thermococcus sp. GR5]